MNNNIVSLYCDGGVCGRNPSPTGGTWAWCGVNATGDRIARAGGFVEPADVGLPTITNNLTELLAAIHGMESLPDGWTGTIFTDSNITRMRIAGISKKFAGIPESMRARLRFSLKRLGKFRVVLLGGHPTKEDLFQGFRKDGGLPVSKHNVWCDNECTRQKGELGNKSRRTGAVA